MAPYSLALVLRDLGEFSDTKIASKKMLDAAQRAMELHRDFIVQAIVPEVVNTFEQEYRAKWDELEDLAKNTLATIRQEAEEAESHTRRADTDARRRSSGRHATRCAG